MTRESQRPHAQSGVFTKIKALLKRNRLGELLVVSGHISTEDLRFALAEHKRTAQPLGQVFLTHSMISRRQLNGVLMRQTMLRITATALMAIIALSSFHKRARAEIIQDIPASISLNVPVTATTAVPMSSFPKLFGTSEKRSSNLSAFTKWSGMFNRLDGQMKTESGKLAMQKMHDRIQAFKGHSLKAMASEVNSMMNEKPYILDNKNWGQSDYWSTVVDFMNKGGDCEDFAIAKYTALRALGVSEDRMRVAIVQDLVKNIPHAVLVVYTEDGPVILDNQNKALVDGSDMGRYKPIFSINREAWWLHTAPAGTQMASR